MIAAAIVGLAAIAPWFALLPIGGPAGVLAHVIALVAACHGAGWLLGRATRQVAEPVLAIQWGLAVLVGVSGLAMMMRVDGLAAHAVLVYGFAAVHTGALVAGFAARRAQLEAVRWRTWLVPALVLAGLMAIVVVAAAGQLELRPFDDDGHVLGQLARLRETGWLGDPIGYPRGTQLGGQLALGSLATLGGDVHLVGLLEPLAMALALALAFARLRGDELAHDARLPFAFDSSPGAGVPSRSRPTARASPESSTRSPPDASNRSALDLSARSALDLSARSALDLSARSATDISARSATDIAARSANDRSARSATDISAQSTTDLSARSATDLSAQSANDISAQSTTTPSAHSATDRSARSATEPSARSVTDLSARASTDRSAQSANDISAQSTTTPSAHSATDRSARSATEPSARSATEPSARSVTDLSARAATEPSARSATDPSARSATDPLARSATDLSARSATDLSARSATDLSARSATDISARSTTDASARSVPDTSGATTPGLWALLLAVAGAALVYQPQDPAAAWTAVGLVLALHTMLARSAPPLVPLGVTAGALIALRFELAPIALVALAAAWWTGRTQRRALIVVGSALAVVLPYLIARALAWRGVPDAAHALLAPSRGSVIVRVALYAGVLAACAPLVVVVWRQRALRWFGIAAAFTIAGIASQLTGDRPYATHLLLALAFAGALIVVCELARSHRLGAGALLAALLIVVAINDGREATGRRRWVRRAIDAAANLEYLRHAGDPSPVSGGYDALLREVPAGATVAVWVARPERLDYATPVRIVDVRTPRGARLRVHRWDDHRSRFEALLAAAGARYLLVEVDDALGDRLRRDPIDRFVCGWHLPGCADDLDLVAERHHTIAERGGIRLIELAP